MSQVSSDLDALATDSDVEALMNTSLDTAWGEELKHRLGADASAYVTVHRIAPSLIAKRPSPSERASMDFVRRKTSIPIPRDLRPDVSILVTDFIDGQMLYECWNKLGRFMQFRVACTLRLYLKQLRSLTSPLPGALGDQIVSGFLFEESEYGPFRSALRFRRFCEYIAFVGWETGLRQATRLGKVHR